MSTWTVAAPPDRVRLTRAGEGRWRATIGGTAPLVYEVERHGREWMMERSHSLPPLWHPTLDAFRRHVLGVWIGRWLSAAWRLRSAPDHRAAADAFQAWATGLDTFEPCRGVVEGSVASVHEDNCCLPHIYGNFSDGADLVDLWQRWPGR